MMINIGRKTNKRNKIISAVRNEKKIMQNFDFSPNEKYKVNQINEI